MELVFLFLFLFRAGIAAAAVPPFMFIVQPPTQPPLLSDSHHSFTFQVLLMPATYIHGCFNIAESKSPLNQRDDCK